MTFILCSFTSSLTTDRLEVAKKYLNECRANTYAHLGAGNVDSVRFWAREGLHYLKRKQINDSLLIGKQYNQLSYIESLLEHKEASLTFADSAIFFLKPKNFITKDMLHSYRWKAYEYQVLGDFYRATSALEVALYIADSLQEQKVEVLNDLGTIETHLGNLDKAEDYYKTLLLEEKLDLEMKAIIQANLAGLYLDKKAYSKATELWKEVQEFIENEDSLNIGLLPDFLQIKAQVKRAEGNYEQSIEIYREAIELLEKQPGEKRGAEKARSDLVYLLLEENTITALKECRKSYQYFSSRNKVLKDPYEMESTYLMAVIFYEKYQEEGKVNLLDSCLIYCKKAQEVADIMREGFLYRNSKYTLAKYIKANVELGVDAANELINLGEKKAGQELFFYFLQKGKSQILLDELEEKKVIQLKEEGLLGELYSLELQKLESKDSTKSRTLNDKIETIKQELKKNLSGRIQLNTGNDGLDKLRELSMGMNTTFLEFGEGQDFLYVVKISDGRFSKRKIKMPKDSLKILIKKHLSNLNNPNVSAVDYKIAANQLYTLILDPLAIQDENVVLIPSELIANLPFESLVIEPNGGSTYKKLEYALEQWQFSYLFSSSFIIDTKIEEKQSFCGILPVNQKEGDLSSHEDLIKKLKNKLNGAYFQKEESPSLAVISDQYDFIHISTHGIFFNENPLQSYVYMPGSDSSKLNIGQLYSMIMTQNPFIVLNACETGKGELRSGEGIDNFTRAFFYSGASGIIESSWKINAIQTASIFEVFYASLFEGSDTRTALRVAQLTYLKDQNTDNHFAHPFYWSGFRHFGTTTSLKSKKIEMYHWLLIGISIVLLGLFFYWKIKK